MQRDPRAFLWDVREAAQAIQSFTAGLDVKDYVGNEMVQAAVERKFEVIGEALNQLGRRDGRPHPGRAADRGLSQPADPRLRDGQPRHRLEHRAERAAGAAGCWLLAAVQGLLDDLGP